MFQKPRLVSKLLRRGWGVCNVRNLWCVEELIKYVQLQRIERNVLERPSAADRSP